MNYESRLVANEWPHTEPGPKSAFMEVWEARELLRTLTVRNLKVKYKRSVLGFLWTLLNPLITVAVLVVVFSNFVRIEIADYWAFLVSGYFVWNFLQMTINAGTRVLHEHAALARSVRIPGQVFMLAAIASRLVEFLVEMLLVVIALAVMHHGGVPIGFAALPLLILVQVLLVTGLVLPIATLAAFYDDVQHVLPVVLLILFYLSPVFYPTEFVPEQLRSLYLLNPIATLLGAFQTALYAGELPAASSLIGLGVFSMGICLGGFAIFNHFRRVFVEIL